MNRVKTPEEAPIQMTYMFDCFAEPDGTINMEVRRLNESICKWMIDTREARIREALIKLGWTPPGGK